jgi:hypothetical protein
MRRLKQAFKHAFSVEPPGAAEPTDQQREILDRVCQEVVRRRMTTPALMFLEMSRPLNFLGSQAMHFFQPIVSAVADAKGYEQVAMFLERRGSIEYVCRRIEHFDEAKSQATSGDADER